MVRKRRGRKRALGTRTPMPVPAGPNDLWVLDFVSDQLISGRRFRILAIFDVCTRRCLAAIADFSLSGKRVARELDLLVAVHGKPTPIGSDNGRADQQRHPDLDCRQPGRLALHRPRQAGAERLHRELQWPAARRVPERDAVHLACPGARRPRGMAARLQHRAAALAHRLADARRLCRTARDATGPRRYAIGGLRALAPYHRSDRRVQSPDSGSNWIKVGGNVKAEKNVVASNLVRLWLPLILTNAGHVQSTSVARQTYSFSG